jgi:hypothetical protein
MAITLFVIYLLILLGLFVISLRKMPQATPSMKFICWLGMLTFVDELINVTLKLLHISKFAIYHFYNILELILIAYAFVHFVVARPGKVLLAGIAGGCIALGVVNMIFFQPLNVINTNMLMVECVLCIGMALYALFYIMKNDTTFNIYESPDFILWSAILLLMTGTFFFWACFKFLLNDDSPYRMMLIIIQISINIIVYFSIAVALLIKPKKARNEP